MSWVEPLYVPLQGLHCTCRGGLYIRPAAARPLRSTGRSEIDPYRVCTAPVGADLISARGSGDFGGTCPGAYTMRPYAKVGDRSANVQNRRCLISRRRRSFLGFAYFLAVRGRVMPLMLTLTLFTVRPVVDSTAAVTASCTALATSTTEWP